MGVDSFWAPVNVRPWWEALLNCSMVTHILFFPCSASQLTMTETESCDGRSVPEQLLAGIMDQETVLKLREIQP